MTATTTPKISTRRLTYVKDENLFVADASDLQEFDPRMSLSVTLVSHMTGIEVEYRVTHVEYDEAEGELLYHDLTPVNLPDTAYWWRARTAASRLRIFND